MSFPGYDDSYVRVWLFNGYLDGYTFKDIQIIPEDYLSGIIIQESITQLFPSVQIMFNDAGATALDKQGTSQYAIELALEPDVPAFWDFCTLSLKDSPVSTTSKESILQNRIFNGVDTIAIPLIAKARSRSFGKKSSSKIAKEIVENIFKEIAFKNPKRSRIFYNIDDTIDTQSYIQCAKTDAMFINHLANKAISDEGFGGFISWFDCRRFKYSDNTEYDMRYNFVHPNTLSKQDAWINLLYSQNPEHIEEASEYGGYLPSLIDADGVETALVMSLDTKYVSVFNSRDYIKKAAWYDIENLSYKEKEYSIDDFKFNKLNTTINVNEDIRKQRYDYLYSYYKNETENNQFSRLKYFASDNEKNISALISNDMSRLHFKRQVAVVTYGDTWMWLGDKVRLIVPIISGSIMESISGNWIVGKITHMISFPAMQYTTKLTLFSDEYTGDIRK